MVMFPHSHLHLVDGLDGFLQVNTPGIPVQQDKLLVQVDLMEVRLSNEF